MSEKFDSLIRGSISSFYLFICSQVKRLAFGRGYLATESFPKEVAMMRPEFKDRKNRGIFFWGLGSWQKKFQSLKEKGGET